jgi:multicomponent Na+:H+ antiporter subunit B
VSSRVRLTVFACAVSGLAALLFWGVAGLPAFGHFQGGYGNQLEREVLPERHTTNVVGAVVFDYRGLDTLGEEFILFSAVMGVALLLRKNREEQVEDAPDDTVGSDAVRIAGLLLVAPAFVLGVWLVAFGYVTPGGGFQGGVILAGALLLVYLTGGQRRYSRLTPSGAVELVEASGAGGYAVLGLVGLLAEGAYLQNFLGPGERGTLYAGGSIPLLNWAAALEVSAAMLILFKEFLEEYAAPAARRSSSR